jgi:hypothetical protein
MQVNPESAGSLERPHYRPGGPPYGDLLSRLKPYLPKFTTDPQEAFAYARGAHFERRIVTSLAADQPGPTLKALNLPLLPAELEALLLVLEWTDGAWDRSDLLYSLARDMADRAGAGLESIKEFRTNLAAARTRLQEIHDRDKHKG